MPETPPAPPLAPRVTVLMPVFNGGGFLVEAIRSILEQTFSDFEFLIVDDGSTDDSAAVVSSFADPRIRLVRNGANLGLIASLNVGLGLSRGTYVARMDADDVSLPERLQRQVEYLDAHPEVTVCGSWLEAFDGRTVTLWSPPLTDPEIKCSLLFESVIYHPTVMVRQSALLKGPVRYHPGYPHAEDYELWARMAGNWRFANLDCVLLRYRLHDLSIGRRESVGQAIAAARVRQGMLSLLGLDPAAAELELHQALSTWRIEPDDRFLEQAEGWLLQILRANSEHGVLPQPQLQRFLAKRWYQICHLALPLGSGAYQHFFRSPLSSYWIVPFTERLVFRFRALFGARRRPVHER